VRRERQKTGLREVKGKPKSRIRGKTRGGKAKNQKAGLED